MNLGLIILGIGLGSMAIIYTLSKIVPSFQKFLTEAKAKKALKKHKKEQELAQEIERLKQQEHDKDLKKLRRTAKRNLREAHREKDRKAKKLLDKLNIVEKARKLQELKNTLGEKTDKVVGKSKKAGKFVLNKGKNFAQNTKDRISEKLNQQSKPNTKEIIQPKEHLASPVDEYFEKIIEEKQNRINQLTIKPKLTTQEKQELRGLKQEVEAYRSVNSEKPEPVVVQEDVKEPMEKLATPNIEYDLTVIQEKLNAINFLKAKQTLTKIEKKELAKLEHETNSFLSQHPDYNSVLLKVEIGGKQHEQDIGLAPSQQENQEKKEMTKAVEAFAKEHPEYAKYMENFLPEKGRKKNKS